jgi:glycosyltransferase involved in cell wall biosynthesis
LESAAGEQRAKDYSFDFPSVEVIPHGVDTDIFRPLETTEAVSPRHSACAELWADSAVMVEPAFKIINEKILTEGWLVTPESVAEALERLYADGEFLEEMSERAYRLATRVEYRWENISARWDALFREVLAETARP